MPAQKKLGNHHWVEFNYLTVAEMKAKPDPKAQAIIRYGFVLVNKHRWPWPSIDTKIL